MYTHPPEQPEARQNRPPTRQSMWGVRAGRGTAPTCTLYPHELLPSRKRGWWAIPPGRYIFPFALPLLPPPLPPPPHLALSLLLLYCFSFASSCLFFSPPPPLLPLFPPLLLCLFLQLLCSSPEKMLVRSAHTGNRRATAKSVEELKGGGWGNEEGEDGKSYETYRKETKREREEEEGELEKGEEAE